MNLNYVFIAIFGIISGILITAFYFNSLNNKISAGFMGNSLPTSMMNMMGDHSSMSMEDMTDDLKNRQGDEFDKAFLEMMIDHHQGAIDMANEVKQRAKHDELKELSDNIIKTQTEEIRQMRQWLNDWGY